MATIYKILSPCLKECYVGSTIQKVEARWSKHRSDETSSSILFEKYGYDNCKFVVLEVCPLEERYEKEQWWLDHSVGTVNKRKANLTSEARKEEQKEYREANTDKKKAYEKEYYEANTDKIKAYSKEYYEANIDRIRARDKEYYEANIDRIKAYKKERYEARKALNQMGK